MRHGRRFLTVFGIFVILNVFVIDWLAPRIRSEEFFLRTLGAVADWATAPGSHKAQGDSWWPMSLAYEQARSGGDTPLYAFFDEGIKFQYPPTSLLFMTPLSVAPKRTVFNALNNVSWIAVLVSVFASMAIFALSWRRYLPRWDWLVFVLIGLAGLLALTFFPIIDSYRLGQVQTWLNAAAALLVLAWLTKREALAGVILGFMCLVKPQYAVIYLWGLARKRWSFVRSATVTAGLGLGLSVALFGLRSHLDYLSVISYLSRRGEVYFPNQTFNGLLNRLFHRHDPTAIMEFTGAFPDFNLIVYVGTLLAGLVLIGLCLFWRPPKDGHGKAVDFMIPLITATIASPIAWEHHYGVLLPIFAFLLPVIVASATGRQLPIWLLGVAYLLCAHPFVMREGPRGYRVFQVMAGTYWNVFFSYMFFGALMVLGLLYAQRQREVAAPLET